jgi:hypothetical protein
VSLPGTRLIHVYTPDIFRELAPGLVSCCDSLRTLHCAWAVFSALPATCPGFTRLTELRLDGAGVNFEVTSSAWQLMADGRLPALATLHVQSNTRVCFSRAEGEGGFALGRALEGVAGTLRRLTVTCVEMTNLPDGHGPCYELGAAIGKLGRLRYLSLHMFSDGRAFGAVGQGLAASGGCPELFELSVGGPRLVANVDSFILEGGLIVPSVRDLDIEAFCKEEEALSVCCALAQTGYKYRFESHLRESQYGTYSASVHACMRAILPSGLVIASLVAGM